MQIQCPSGLVFTARKWRIGDHSVLLDMKEHQGSSLPMKMLELAATSIVNPGPYKFKDKLITEDMSIADITTANVLLRVGTDPVLVLRLTCAHCRKPLREAVDVLLDELPVYPASKEGAEHLRTGVPVQRTYNGVSVALRAPRGKDLERLSKLQEQEPKFMIEYQLATSVAELKVPGKEGPLTLFEHIKEFIHEQDWSFREQLENDVDELWGGVDQGFTFQCDHACSVTQEQQVPLDLAFYGLDLSAKQSRRRRCSSAKSAGELMRSSSSPSSSASPKPPLSTSGV